MAPAPVLLVLGPERFLAREAVARAVEGRGGLELSRYDGDEVAVGALLDELKTPTLFGGARGVVVENAGALLSGEALDALARYAERPVPGTLLVLQASSLDGRLKGAKRLKESAEVVACDPVPDWKVAEWIEPHARRRHGLRLDRAAAEALRERVGEDLGLLDAALRRLREQIAPRTELRRDDVVASTEGHRSPALFEAANAVEARDRDAALRAVDACFAEGLRIRQDTVTESRAVAPILLGNLHQAYLRLLRFHLARRAGLADAEAARQAGVSPRATRFFLERARRHRLEALVARHRQFVDADAALKRGGGGDDPRRTLARLVLGLLS